MKRICLFSLNDPKGVLDGYVRNLIGELEKVSVVYAIYRSDYDTETIPLPGEQLVFCPRCRTEAAALKQTILSMMGERKLEEYDELIMVNDSFFGPFTSVDNILRTAEEKDAEADFWGLVAKNENEKTVKVCRYHYQPWFLYTFFLVVRERMLRSEAFREYWKSMKNYVKESSAKEGHEFAFTKYFQDVGFKAFSFFECGKEPHSGGLVFNCLPLLREGLPILQKLSFTVPYDRVLEHGFKSQFGDCVRFIREHTSYDCDLIYDAIIRVADPYTISCVLNLNYVLPEVQANGRPFPDKEKTAVVIYIGRVEHIAQRLPVLDALPDWVDVFLVTGSEDLTLQLVDLLGTRFPALKRRATVLTGSGNGRDIGSFLVEARPYLRDYVYIGFIPGSLQSAGVSSLQEDEYWMKSMIGQKGCVEQILSVFESEPRLGALFPPRLEHGGHFASIGRGWTGNVSAYCELCERIGIPDCVRPTSPPLSTKFVCWCRYEALEPLLNWEWEFGDFPEEPIGKAGTVYHAITRSLSYIARKRGFFSGTVCTAEIASALLNNRGYYLTSLIPLLNRYIRLRGSLSNCMVQIKTGFRKRENELQEKDSALAKYRWRYYLNKKEREIRKKERVIRRSRFFDEKWYREQNPGLKRFRGSAAEHYLTDGWKQGKDPSPRFSTKEYLELNPGVARARLNPLLHYETHGIIERRRYRLDLGGYFSHHLWRKFQRATARVVFQKEIQANRNARILVILHLFYMSSWKEIKEYLMNLQDYQYDLIVTYTNAIVDKKVLEDIRAFKPEAELIQCENLGFDVIPYLDVLKMTDLSQYDIVFKLQSKGVHRRQIYIYGQYFRKRDWFLNLFEGCIGPFAVHKTIAALMDQNNQIGIVAAENLLVKDPPHKLRMVEAYMRENGIGVPSEYRYVAGTCFAERAFLANEVKKLDYDLAAIRSSGRGFSTAHKLERIICLTALNQGYRMGGNRVLRIRRFIRSLHPGAIQSKKYSPEKVWQDPRFKLDDEFVYFSLELKKVVRYELVNLPLKDIRRQWLKKPIRLKDCHPYKYLVSGDPKIYEEYCRLNKKHYNLDIMSRERFDALIRSMEENSFNEKNVIVVNQNNILLDGQHRCCYMLYKYGEECTVPTLRIYLAEESSFKSRTRRMIERRLPKKAYIFIMHRYIALKKLVFSLLR